jgi:hypothetical protein
MRAERMMWPFPTPPNTATVTVRQIIEDGDPILYVVHDAEEGWQFLTGGKFVVEDSRLVALRVMVELDPTLRQLADLPPGWEAERTDRNQPWRRWEMPYEDS